MVCYKHREVIAVNNYETVQKIYGPLRSITFRFASSITIERVRELTDKAEEKLNGEKNYSNKRAEEVLREVLKEEEPSLLNALDEIGYKNLLSLPPQADKRWF